MTITDLIAILSLTIAGLSLLVAVASWRKNRAIYGFTRKPLRMPTGTERDIAIVKVDDSINKMLSSGKWTVLDIVYRHADKDYDLILGKIEDKSVGFIDRRLQKILG